VVSDLVTTAYLADVYLLPEHRGRGIGHFLVASILGHPALATVKWLLHTEDAQSLYRHFGFLDRTERLMERPAPGRSDS
jgi:GNAT superfamily N-acetyltransferase